MHKPYTETISLFFTGLVDTIFHPDIPSGIQVRYYLINTCDISDRIGLVDHPQNKGKVHVRNLHLVCENMLKTLLNQGVNVVIQNI